MKKLSFWGIMTIICSNIWGQTANQIENTGDVGIGTTNPSAKLHVNSDASQAPLRVQLNGSTKFYVNSGGGVSIGSTYNMHSNGLYVQNSIKTPISKWIGICNGNLWDIGSPRLALHNEGKHAYIDFKDNLNFRADNPGISPLIIQGDGNVAIGYPTSYATDGSQYRTDGYKLGINGDVRVENGWLRVKGQRGLYFQDYGGGFYMQDDTWIRTYNNKSFYHNSGIMRTDGTFQVGSGGSRFLVNGSGDVGIGNTSPNAALDIKRDGVALEIDHTTSGGHSMIKFNSVVNNGSDKGFILFQDESSNNSGTGGEDVRLTMGVFNDFRSSSSHSDELWFQGGGRLVQNVGKWDAELNTIIGTPSSGTTGGYEWRVDNSKKMSLSHTGQLDVCGTVRAKEVKVEEFTCSNGFFDGTLAANNITIKANGNTADFVFEENYDLKDLSEVETFIKTNKHLPDIPSAAQMEEQGVNLAEMNKLLLQKVEELTLYVIELEKRINKTNK